MIMLGAVADTMRSGALLTRSPIRVLPRVSVASVISTREITALRLRLLLKGLAAFVVSEITTYASP